ncbi:MAG: peptidase M49 [Acidimicrobiia bacterium]|nr:peptidase M49 [Acidimicrobiia bacterium]
MHDSRPFLLERIDDVAVVQLYADGFASLPLGDRILVWHLYLAALAGRDIYYDQRHRQGLEMRDVLEAILVRGRGVDARVLAEIRRYTKLFWINTGPYNNLTARKFVLNVTRDELAAAAAAAGVSEERVDRLAPMFFDADVDPIVTSKSPGPGQDILQASSNNLYAGVASADLAGFRERHGLNSRLVKRNGALSEEVYRVGGRYDREIRRIIGHLEDAIPCATPALADALRALIRYYQSGEDADRVAYDVAWVRDRDSPVDTVNGFVEVYLDPRGVKGAWEALVYYVNAEKTRAIQTLAAHASWFEAAMPWEPRFRKADAAGVTARAIDVVVETGDAGPVTAIGVNLPNDQAVREACGSKSISLSNVTEAHERSTPEAMRTEFSWDDAEAERARRWGAFAQELSTAMHEVIGHGSGRMADGVAGAPQQYLKECFSAIEEARADLVALYFLADPKLVELGLVTAADHDEVVRTEYEYYARNALLQLRRVRHGTQLEEDHMRNRHLIVSWLMAHTNALERRRRDGKTYFVLVDARAFREGAGRLLAEVQRIKGEGDYAAATRLLDTYAVHVDPALRDEIVARADALSLPSYTGFVMPRLEARYDGDGRIADVEISYPGDLETQMLEYSAFARRGDPWVAREETDVLPSHSAARAD